MYILNLDPDNIYSKNVLFLNCCKQIVTTDTTIKHS